MKKEDLDAVTTDDILSVIGPADIDTCDLLKGAVHYDIHGGGKQWPIIALLAHKIMLLEETIMKNGLGPPGSPQRMPRAKKVPVPDLPGVMHQKAIEAGLSDDLKEGDAVAIPCPDCGSDGMSVRATKDGKRLFVSCPTWRTTGCKGSISYKSFSELDTKTG